MRRVILYGYNKSEEGERVFTPIYASGPWWAHAAIWLGSELMAAATHLRWWGERHVKREEHAHA